jgi:ankyrin repeat protein
MLAAMGGHLEVVELLINAGADATAVSSDGYTALSAASEFQHQVGGGCCERGVASVWCRHPQLANIVMYESES